MFKQPLPDLSVIVSSCRPKWLVNCLHQLGRQDVDFGVEVVVVAEGDQTGFRLVAARFPTARFYYKDVEGFCGAFAKDFGIGQAWGEYVCFCDDDNIYYPHAIRSLLDAARGNDIGVVRVAVMGLGWRVVPADPELRRANLDSMCLCVRRRLALRARWSDHRGPGTDYAWVRKLTAFDPAVRFSEALIGEHLD